MQICTFTAQDFQLHTSFLLSEDTIHLWLFPLSCKEILSADQSLLTEEELTRISRFSAEEDRARYRISHIALKKLLCLYLSCGPEDLQFSLLQHGKPVLQRTKKVPSPIHFNLSHSGDYVLLGFCASAPVGVDIEKPRKSRNLESLVRNFYHPEEKLHFQTLKTDEEKEDFFYQTWTKKEALLKGIGSGLTIPLSSFSVLSGSNRVGGGSPPLDSCDIRTAHDFQSFAVLSRPMSARASQTAARRPYRTKVQADLSSWTVKSISLLPDHYISVAYQPTPQP